MIKQGYHNYRSDWFGILFLLKKPSKEKAFIQKSYKNYHKNLINETLNCFTFKETKVSRRANLQIILKSYSKLTNSGLIEISLLALFLKSVPKSYWLYYYKTLLLRKLKIATTLDTNYIGHYPRKSKSVSVTIQCGHKIKRVEFHKISGRKPASLGKEFHLKVLKGSYNNSGYQTSLPKNATTFEVYDYGELSRSSLFAIFICPLTTITVHPSLLFAQTSVDSLRYNCPNLEKLITIYDTSKNYCYFYSHKGATIRVVNKKADYEEKNFIELNARKVGTLCQECDLDISKMINLEKLVVEVLKVFPQNVKFLNLKLLNISFKILRNIGVIDCVNVPFLESLFLENVECLLQNVCSSKELKYFKTSGSVFPSFLLPNSLETCEVKSEVLGEALIDHKFVLKTTILGLINNFRLFPNIKQLHIVGSLTTQKPFPVLDFPFLQKVEVEFLKSSVSKERIINFIELIGHLNVEIVVNNPLLYEVLKNRKVKNLFVKQSLITTLLDLY